VTQQNASASEEMSATSEELAAQSEQLQTSIAYFRVDANTANGGSAPHRHDPAPKHGIPHAVTGKPVKAAASLQPRHAALPAKRNGFALNLAAGGADHRDAEFERM